MRRIATPSPLITLHETGDAWVPLSLEQSYRRRTIAAGASDLLVQRVFRAGSHCGFYGETRERTFDDLVAWGRARREAARRRRSRARSLGHRNAMDADPLPGRSPVREEIRGGFDGSQGKPISVRELLATVREILDKPSSQL